jgi:hypothetical protein
VSFAEKQKPAHSRHLANENSKPVAADIDPPGCRRIFRQRDRGVTMFAYHFAKTLNRKDIPQGFITMSSGTKNQMASPLSWTAFAGVKNVKRPEFRARLDELFLQYPNTDIAIKAIDDHLREVRAFVSNTINAQRRGEDLSIAVPFGAPAFPEAGKNSAVKADTIPNLCVQLVR